MAAPASPTVNTHFLPNCSASGLAISTPRMLTSEPVMLNKPNPTAVGLSPGVTISPKKSRTRCPSPNSPSGENSPAERTSPVRASGSTK